MSFEILFRSRVTYFILAVATVFVAAFFILQKIEDLSLMASPMVEKPVIPERQLDILFVGDTMLDRVVRNLMTREGLGYPFLLIKDFVRLHDFGILNLEGVFTDNDSVSVKNMEILRFTFNPKAAPILKDTGFNAVSQANNHTNDFGREGLQSSKRYLSQSGISGFGDFFNESEPMFLDSKGQKVAVVGFNEFSNINFERINTQISEAKAAGYFTVVMPHWGVEYQRFPSEFQTRKAHEWIDLGADAVIGSHPHVIQTIEEYDGKVIFYSLGNFVFDQNFSKQTEEGLAVTLILTSSTASFTVSAIGLQKAQPRLLPAEERVAVLESLAADSDIKSEWKENLILGKGLDIAR